MRRIYPFNEIDLPSYIGKVVISKISGHRGIVVDVVSEKTQALVVVYDYWLKQLIRITPETFADCKTFEDGSPCGAEVIE